MHQRLILRFHGRHINVRKRRSVVIIIVLVIMSDVQRGVERVEKRMKFRVGE